MQIAVVIEIFLVLLTLLQQRKFQKTILFVEFNHIILRMDHALKIAKSQDYKTGRNVRRFQLIVNVYATGT